MPATPAGTASPAWSCALRNETPVNQAIGEAIASMLKDNLGINVQVSNKDQKLFMDSLNAHQLPFYIVSYGLDYLDPSNMLGIWVSGGRHAWVNGQFDRLVKEATSLAGNKAKRDQEFKEAEKILVDDVGGIFIYHVDAGQCSTSRTSRATELEPDKTGVAAWHWPGLEDVGVAELVNLRHQRRSQRPSHVTVAEEALLEVRGLETRFKTPEGLGPRGQRRLLQPEKRGDDRAGGRERERQERDHAHRAAAPAVARPREVIAGSAFFHGQDLLAMSDRQIRDARGSQISMVFQDPMTSFNPVLTIGRQITEPLQVHLGHVACPGARRARRSCSTSWESRAQRTG